MTSPGSPPPHTAADNATLKTALERLRGESATLGSDGQQPGARAESLVSELEQQLDATDTSDLREAMRHRVQGAIREFETEHPAFTAALGQFLEALGSMGI